MTANKCGKCEFVGKTELQLKKHFNTKHPNKCVETADEKKSGVNNANCTLDGINDMFQIEIVDGEQVYVCSICDEGFDTDDEIRNHILKDHEEIVLQINEGNEEEEESDLDESYGDSWLAKFNNDGDLIG